jgi:hypothetical protein
MRPHRWERMDRRRELVVVSIVVAIASTVFVIAAPEDRAATSLDRRLTTLRASPDGALAFYLTLADLGIPVEQRLTPLVDVDSLPLHLALLAPTEAPTPREVAALHERVASGGTLIYVAREDDPLLQQLGLDLVWIQPAMEQTPFRTVSGVTANPVSHRWTDGIHRVAGFTHAFVGADSTARPGTPLLVAEDTFVVGLELRVGAGRVLAVSDAAPLSNGRIAESGAALLFVRAAREMTTGDEPLVFDEFHHGARGGSVFSGVRRFLVEQRAGHGVVQLMLVLLVALLAAGRRLGSALPAPARMRRSPLEHVDALAQLYREARAYRIPNTLLIAGLARRLGRARPQSDAEATTLIHRLGAAVPAAAGAATALDQTLHSDTHDLLGVSRGVDRLMDELGR